MEIGLKTRGVELLDFFLALDCSGSDSGQNDVAPGESAPVLAQWSHNNKEVDLRRHPEIFK